MTVHSSQFTVHSSGSAPREVCIAGALLGATANELSSQINRPTRDSGLGTRDCVRFLGRQRGFTLLEALVGITIFSLVVVALYAGFRVGVRSWDAGERSHTTTSELRIAGSFVRRNLSQTFPLAVSEGSAWRLWFQGLPRKVVFVTQVPAYLGQGGVYEMILSVDDEGESERLMVSRRLLHPDVEPGRAGVDDEARPLVADLKSAEFAFFGTPRGAADPAWHNTWEGAQRLPSLVRLRMESEAAGEWPELLVRLQSDGIRYQRSATSAGTQQQGNFLEGRPLNVPPGVRQ